MEKNSNKQNLYTKMYKKDSMVDLKDKELNKKLKKIEKEEIPSLEEIKKKDGILKGLEKKFKKKFWKKTKK